MFYVIFKIEIKWAILCVFFILIGSVFIVWLQAEGYNPILCYGLMIGGGFVLGNYFCKWCFAESSRDWDERMKK